jgi:NADH-quinone oxidoreductase subunit L
LAGFPGFAGFFSKDLILESLFETGLTLSIPIFFLICFAAGFTAGYSIKSYAKSYFYNAGFSSAHLQASAYVFYSSKLFLVFLIFLLSSIALGYAIHGFFEHDFFSLSLLSLHGNLIPNDLIPFELYFFPFILAAIGAIFSFFIHRDTVLTFPINLYFKNYFSFFRRDYVLNEFFNYILIGQSLSLLTMCAIKQLIEVSLNYSALGALEKSPLGRMSNQSAASITISLCFA